MGVRAFIKLVKRTFADVNIQMSKPANPDGVWFVDFFRGATHVVFQQQHPKYGLTKITKENEKDFTSQPEEVFSDQATAFIRIVELLAVPTENHELLAYVTLADQMWREHRGWFVSEPMMELSKRMQEKLVIRDNNRLFEHRKLPDGSEARISIQCGPGWYRIIGDTIDKIVAETQAMEWKDYRLQITCVKEKFAGLRIYFSIMHKDGLEPESRVMQTLYDSISGHINVAEVLCRSTCEDCGEGGHMRGNVGEWMQTLCDRHSKLKGRTETPPEIKLWFGPRNEAVDKMLAELQEQQENDKLRIRRDGSPQDGTTSPA